MNNLNAKINESIEILREYEPKEGYYVCFSGGKDSQVILDLVQKSGCKYDAHFQFTTVEYPETMKYIKKYYPEVKWDIPKLTMYQLIEKNKAFPTRLARFCCRILKEYGGENRLKITGIRSQESNSRKMRNKFEFDKNNPETKMIHLIIDWNETEVWEYINKEIGHHNPMYDNGFKRVGCIGCPMGSRKQLENQFKQYPNHKKAYINSIQKALNVKPNKHFGTNANKMFEWWISNKSISNFLSEENFETEAKSE